ncbi:polyketide synthase docking domain-containing protein, partial [Streptomyces rubellomurinus]
MTGKNDDRRSGTMNGQTSGRTSGQPSGSQTDEQKLRTYLKRVTNELRTANRRVRDLEDRAVEP